MHIKIGEAKTLSVENWEVTLDDRQTKLETIGGVVVQDFGHVDAGDSFSCTVTLSRADAEILRNYWHNRTLVTVTDEAGVAHENLRVIIKSYSYVPHFKDFYRVSLEFWRE